MPEPTIRGRLISALKGVRVASQLGMFVAVSAIGSKLLRDPKRSRAFRTRTTRYYSRKVLKSLGVRVTSHGTPQAGNVLVVSNHLSYLDVLALSSVNPSVFVTSVEVRDTPVLGTLCRAGGSLFVERRAFASLKEEVTAISSLLQEGFTVVLFPEGTSSSGAGILPFRKSLLDSAVTAKCQVQPLCLNYVAANEKPLTSETRDSIFYYGDIEFFDHLKRLLALKSIDLKVTWLKLLEVDEGSDRKFLAHSAREQIAAAYLPVNFPAHI